MFLFSRRIDILFLFLPVFLTWIALFTLPDHVLLQKIPVWLWFVLVVGVDVSHVWSSLFRTYFDPHDRFNHRKLLKVLPFLVLFFCFAVAYSSIDLFWRLMAYLALYHFMKQQYGFMVLYGVKSKTKFSDEFKWDKRILFFSMFYPIIYWHLNPNLNFSWFTSDDFVINHWFEIPEFVFNILNGLYFLILIVWLFLKFKKGIQCLKDQMPYLLWILTTALNWYIGIVYFNSDLAFTATNVIAHGIPYLVLISFYKQRKKRIVTRRSSSFISLFILVFLVAFFFGVLEEYWWEVLVNQDKKMFFSSFTYYFSFQPLNELGKAFFIGLLSVPQVTHYILDGFIWKANDLNPYLQKVLSDNR